MRIARTKLTATLDGRGCSNSLSRSDGGNSANHKSMIIYVGPNIVPLPIIRPEPGKRVVPIKTQARAATILPNFVGLHFQVYNGRVYNDVTITEDMVGHKLGEFSPTRKPFIWDKN